MRLDDNAEKRPCKTRITGKGPQVAGTSSRLVDKFRLIRAWMVDGWGNLCLQTCSRRMDVCAFGYHHGHPVVGQQPSGDAQRESDHIVVTADGACDQTSAEPL